VRHVLDPAAREEHDVRPGLARDVLGDVAQRRETPGQAQQHDPRAREERPVEAVARVRARHAERRGVGVESRLRGARVLMDAYRRPLRARGAVLLRARRRTRGAVRRRAREERRPEREGAVPVVDHGHRARAHTAQPRRRLVEQQAVRRVDGDGRVLAGRARVVGPQTREQVGEVPGRHRPSLPDARPRPDPTLSRADSGPPAPTGLPGASVRIVG